MAISFAIWIFDQFKPSLRACQALHPRQFKIIAPQADAPDSTKLTKAGTGSKNNYELS
jgi:hypothetical protein